MIRACFLLFFLFPAGLCAQSIMFAAPQSPPTIYESICQSNYKSQGRIISDFANLYNCNDAGNFGSVLLGSALLANTKMDRNFKNWYQDDVRTRSGDKFAKVAKVFGEGQIFIPIMATSALSYRLLQDRQLLPDCILGDFTSRTFRGYLVGAPTLLVFQQVLGGDRPCWGPSYWKPFHQPVALSGHAFIGAVPFITAAQMTNDIRLKCLYYTLSTFTAWSRVNDDRHYLSQAILGWYLAYLSVRAVTKTESFLPLSRGLTIFPITDNGSIGAGVHYRF